MAKARMMLFCNDVVWDPESHLAAAEMLKESTPGSELWCVTNLCTSPLCASRLCKALAAGAAAGLSRSRRATGWSTRETGGSGSRRRASRSPRGIALASARARCGSTAGSAWAGAHPRSACRCPRCRAPCLLCLGPLDPAAWGRVCRTAWEGRKLRVRSPLLSICTTSAVLLHQHTPHRRRRVAEPCRRPRACPCVPVLLGCCCCCRRRCSRCLRSRAAAVRTAQFSVRVPAGREAAGPGVMSEAASGGGASVSCSTARSPRRLLRALRVLRALLVLSPAGPQTSWRPCCRRC